jgi:hypothetical protein
MSLAPHSEKPSWRAKLPFVGFAALLTAMVIFAGGAKGITMAYFDNDPKASNWPLIAFVPALLIAGILAVVCWRASNWRRFAIYQMAAAAIVFVILLIVLGP